MKKKVGRPVTTLPKDRKHSFTVSLSFNMRNDIIRKYKSLTGALNHLWNESNKNEAEI